MAPKVAGKKGEKKAGKAKAAADGKKKRRGLFVVFMRGAVKLRNL